MKSAIFLVAVAAAIVAVMAAPATYTRVWAEPDCEQVGVHDNPQGNAAGNGQQCVGGPGDSGEPVRDCDHKNSEKDNNDNGFFACIPRGHSTDEGD